MKIKSLGFNNTNKKLTNVGLGGEGVLRTTGENSEAFNVIQKAVESGITYCDSARVYKDSEIYYGQYWKENPDKKAPVFQTSKSAERSKAGALKDLNESLERLGADHLDLWQIHDVRDERDLSLISQKGGALEAFVQAKEKGLVKNIGVTGHHDPEILARAVEMWPVDSVLMPVNPVEEVIGGFLTRTLEAAHKKGIAVIAMKILGGKHYISDELGISAELLIRFALSYDITVAIVGCRTPDEVETLVKAGNQSSLLTRNERDEIVKPYMRMAQRLAFYRGSIFNKP